MAVEIPLIFILAPLAGIASIIIAFLIRRVVLQADPGNAKMQEVSGYIAKGAKAFLKRQYSTLAVFVAGIAILVLVLPVTIQQNLRPVPNAPVNWEQMVAYIAGSISSMWAGYLGMMTGIKANSRSAQACNKSLKAGFDVAFFGGAFMGLAVVGSALIGVSLLYLWIPDPTLILGFSFGASSIALFAKAGGGIYTKTADVGADLVGKAEYNLPEDDPRNPAAIADNVGDNVGDIAGMGSDLYDSYVASIVASMLLAAALVVGKFQTLFVILPLLLCGIGLIASLLGIIYIRSRGSSEPGKALNTGTYLAAVLFLGLMALFNLILMIGLDTDSVVLLWKLYFATIVGLGAGILIGVTSDYYTDSSKKPTKNIAKAAEDGHPIVILSGLSYGLISVVPGMIGIVIAMAVSYILAGILGIAIAAVGMLSIIGTIVSNDAYGPIVDNARSIAEYGGLGEEPLRNADALDAAGNTAKAITKGFAIGAANLTVIALLFTFSEEAASYSSDFAHVVMDIRFINILIGAFIGVVAPALFSAILILAVQRNAGRMVEEIRRQFKANPKILEEDPAKREPADFERCIDIATKGAIRELVIPIIISLALPITVGVIFGVAALAAFLAGSILSGFVFAIFMSNAGGAWDNAKKFIEDNGLDPEGKTKGKGTEIHKAAITGDTVGDPLKDTSGPSINTLLCVMSLTSSMFMGFLFLFNNGMGLLGAVLG